MQNESQTLSEILSRRTVKVNRPEIYNGLDIGCVEISDYGVEFNIQVNTFMVLY